MTTFSIYIFFIIIIALLLLSINFLFSTHNPYMEKKTAFECGFHSFLGQNRTQFTISFFIFALLFLLFDLEILLIYPYTISAYNNNGYGLVIMLVFFVLLTAGLSIWIRKKSFNYLFKTKFF